MKGSKCIAVVIAIVMAVIGSVPAGAYTFSQTRKESPQDFNEFLDDCTLSERVQIMQALQDLPSDYNTAKTDTVIAAINSGRLNAESVSPEAIRKAIVWRAYNKLAYPFKSYDEIDYHGILQWAAEKSDITTRRINEYSTFGLEKEIAEEHFTMAWEKMTPEERAIVLPVPGAGTMKGAAAFGAMGFSVGDVVSTLLAMRDIWNIIGAESETVCNFILTVNLIKTRKYAR